MTTVMATRLDVDARIAAPLICALEQALGRTSACPRRVCTFWEEGGAVIRPGCALSRSPLDLGQAGVADRLLSLRQRVTYSRSAEDGREAYREFREVLAAVFDDDRD